MDIYQSLFEYGPYLHYLVFNDENLIGVFDNIKDACKMILDEPFASNIKIKELYVSKSWKSYKKNMKVYETANKSDISKMCILADKYINITRTLGIYELIFLKFMINPELLVRNEKLVRITKKRLNEFYKSKGRSSAIMKEFKLFLKHALRRYDSYCYRPYNLRSNKNRFT